MKARERILTTATDLFHNQGYNSTGINQIIEESGVARGSFYYNFKSKEDLCVTFLTQRHNFWLENLTSFISRSKKRSESPSILLAFDYLSYMNKKENFRGCSFLNILSEISGENHKILTVIQNHKNDVRQYIASLLEDGELKDHIYLLFEGALIESQLFRSQWPVEKAKTIAKSLIE